MGKEAKGEAKELFFYPFFPPFKYPPFFSLRLSQPCISVLLQSGAWVDQQDSLGLTPSHWAVSHEQHKALVALLEGGANWYVWW